MSFQNHRTKEKLTERLKLNNELYEGVVSRNQDKWPTPSLGTDKAVDLGVGLVRPGNRGGSPRAATSDPKKKDKVPGSETKFNTSDTPRLSNEDVEKLLNGELPTSTFMKGTTSKTSQAIRKD